jgi:hypothetical protein
MFWTGAQPEFFSCLVRAHAGAPYRVEGSKVYVYDPNHPWDRERFVELFRRGGGEFVYDGFRSIVGWGDHAGPAA